MKSTQTGHRWAAMMVAAMLMMLAAAIASPAQTYKVLYSFSGGSGSQPVAGLVRDAGGNLYGTTSSGGLRWGTVFKLNKSGKETLLYRFAGGVDGANPFGALLLDSAGTLYGTTAAGGLGYGTVFKVDQSGHETVLFSFTGGMDGASPYDGLVRDEAGNLYGTTLYGGSGTGCYPLSTIGCGTVFELDVAGREAVLYSFSGGSDGGLPYAGLIRDGAGSLYGTTQPGGRHLVRYVRLRNGFQTGCQR
ncbi:MAG TPA: choice-of-anchor tandem repeat GloVer-containing protein [Terriglobia bacterium]|nr:choice-of-anchor tandem repeat GloVer-containing protein [Terriglobia bacterium]